MSRQDDRSRRDRVARYVIARRGQLGVSQRELADRAGLNPKTVFDVEQGKRSTTPKTHQKLEPALGWERGDLARIAEGGYPVTGPLPGDDLDGVIAAATSGELTESEFDSRVRQVISQLPVDSQPIVEELYDMLQDAERQNRRLRRRIVQLMPRNDEGDGDRESSSQQLPNS
ncbi:helix-turn-helix domain-containing protein [Actinomadura sp. CNU-125]|uniref:helix-turn-helix domain-containing protein n=1 Tax=Actinomadura sp. CNU-125 TaxID=1904961 RepID=UPI001300E749|nr:helix-turn-helix transcriptional regulator [Actinomadura sp. CNU-125]